MGNHLCSGVYPSNTIKIIRFDDGVERIKVNKLATKVAEVMLDYPNQFVCNLGSLQAGRRILALPAEEELERGNVYILLPMHKLRSVMSDSDMGVVEEYIHHHKQNKSGPAKKKLISSNSIKIVPVCDNGDGVEKKALPKLEVNEEELVRMRMRIEGCKCWKPALHTIEECRSFKV